MAKRLGQQLVEAGLVSLEAIDSALQQQRITGHRLGDCLLDLGLIQEVALLRFLAAEFKTRFVSAEKLAKAKIAPEALDRVPVRMCEAQCFLPLALDADRKILSIVMAEPQNLALVTEITLVTGMDEVFAYVGVRSAILAAIKKHYYGDHTAFAALEQGGVQALRTDVATMQRAYENDSRPDAIPGSSPGQSVLLDGGGRKRETSTGKGSSSWASSTQLRESLVRGSVGDSDFVETLNILIGLMEMHRKEFRGHSAQVARQATLVGRRMAVSPRDIAHISIAAYLHDLGKRPDKHLTLTAIARSPELKTDAKRYVRAPIKLFETVHLHGGVNTVLAQLYEAYDGSGIPLGSKGDDIAAGARIIAAVDAFLDLTRNPFNPMGRQLTKAEALDHLREEGGKLYDPQVVDTIAHLQEGDLLRQRVETDGRIVIIADPDEGVRTDLNDALNKLGLVAHTVIKLDGVIDAVLTGEADTLVVGLAYGVQDLVNLAGFVRARPESASVPILVVGEPTDPQTRDRLANVGISAFLSTPVEPLEAAGVVRGLYVDRLENGGPGHIVRGSFDELAAAELAKLLGKARKSGRLFVRNGPQEGFVHLERGRAVFASFAGRSGEAAVAGMLAMPQAEFSWEPETLLSEPPHSDKDLEVIALEVEAARSSPPS